MVNVINSSKAKVVYVCNIMTQPGETDDMGIKDHVEAILNHTVDGFVDYCIANNKEIPADILSKYIHDKAKPIYPQDLDIAYLKDKGIKLISDDFINIKDELIRHNAKKLSETIINLI